MANPSNDSAAVERAPLLRVFGDLADRVAALIRVRPDLVARLITAPAEALHSYAAYMHLAPEPALSKDEIADALLSNDPRHLLRIALPGSPAELYRALARVGDRVQPKAFYERLGAICRGPFADLLLGEGNIDYHRLQRCEMLAAMDPGVAALCRALPDDTSMAENLNSVLAYLRVHGALIDDDLTLPRGAGLPAVVRRLRTVFARVTAPDPGFSPPPPFRFVRNTAELQAVGQQFRNCVALPNWGAAERHIRLLDGSEVYLVADDPPVLASLRRVGPMLWRMDQMAGLKNAAPPPGAQEKLLHDLLNGGVHILAADPKDALARLEAGVRQQRGPRVRVADMLFEHDDNDEPADDDMIAVGGMRDG